MLKTRFKNGLKMVHELFPVFEFTASGCNHSNIFIIQIAKDDVFSVSDTGILGLKEKSKCSQLPISTSDALPVSYRRLVVAT